jgi:hypothetical protein
MQGVVWSQDLMGAIKSFKRNQNNLESVFMNFSLSKKETLALDQNVNKEVDLQKQVGTMSYWI